MLRIREFRWLSTAQALSFLGALLFYTVLPGAPLFSARAALLPDILPARHLAIGSAVANTIHQAT